MKRIKTTFAIAFAIMITTYSYATIRTVSNSPSITLAQFSTIQSAIDASVSGDTVYVHGSPIAYAAFTISNKRLSIIGPGWSPDKNLPFAAVVSAQSVITGALSTKTEIQGLTIPGFDVNSDKPDSLRFIRNLFTNMSNLGQASATYRAYHFEGNVFQGGGVNAHPTSIYLDFVFQNNYFFATSSFNNQRIRNFINSQNTILFDHNLWFREGGGVDICFINCQFLMLTNNIFVSRDAASGNSNSSFNNNITFNAGNNTPWLSNGNINSGGNVGNQNPQMVTQASVNAGINNPLLDYSIPAGPANDSGSDGKDMGLLYESTGSLNWAHSRNSRLPRMFLMNISNPTISSGGTLNVNIEARKSN